MFCTSTVKLKTVWVIKMNSVHGNLHNEGVQKLLGSVSILLLNFYWHRYIVINTVKNTKQLQWTRHTYDGKLPQAFMMLWVLTAGRCEAVQECGLFDTLYTFIFPIFHFHLPIQTLFRNRVLVLSPFISALYHCLQKYCLIYSLILDLL